MEQADKGSESDDADLDSDDDLEGVHRVAPLWQWQSHAVQLQVMCWPKRPGKVVQQ